MRRDYSKPSADVSQESAELLVRDAEMLEMQRRVSRALVDGSRRVRCIACSHALDSAELLRHRDIDYALCSSCGHIQTKIHPPAGYPAAFSDRQFHHVYPRLGAPEFASRRDRIYRPKLDWALSCHAELGTTADAMKGLRWLELGAGAGYFLSALHESGVATYSGLDGDARLVEAANDMLGSSRMQHYSGTLSNAVRAFDADVYVAFFVLEHADDVQQFFDAVRARPAGTLLLFSVPTFGFTTLLEGAVALHSARQLDSVMHTQLFTPSSIEHCLSRAGCEIVAQWAFGQDAVDLRRLLLLSLREQYPSALFAHVANVLSAVQDELQTVLDRGGLSDSIHILAVRR
jgi:hypothetical protein